MNGLFKKKVLKKIAIVIVSLISLLLLLNPLSVSANTPGDINYDGRIDVQDVTLALRYVLGVEVLTEAQQLLADVNNDGAVNVQDVTLISQKALELITELPDIPVILKELTLFSEPLLGGTVADETSTGLYATGSLVRIKAVPNDGYSFSHWSAPFGTFADVTVQETIFTMPDGNVAVTAIFEETNEIKPDPLPVSDIVYITKTGERYHRGSCHHLSQSKIPIERSKAKAQGYSPCKVCKP